MNQTATENSKEIKTTINSNSIKHKINKSKI